MLTEYQWRCHSGVDRDVDQGLTESTHDPTK